MKMLAKIAAVGALLTMGSSAMAAVELVQNGGFETTSATTKTSFGSANVANWTIGNGSKLVYLDTPGTADNGAYLSVYGPFPATSPVGGNFVEMDGDPSYSSPISQTLSGLIVGQSYTIDFYQAAGQQVGFTGPTTERWQVSFGGQTFLSDKYSLPQGGVGPWQAQSVTFTASAASQTLSFLAVGTPNGAPPIAFLDGVSVHAVPEPATWMMMIIGFGGVGAALRRRRTGATAIA